MRDIRCRHDSRPSCFERPATGALFAGRNLCSDSQTVYKRSRTVAGFKLGDLACRLWVLAVLCGFTGVRRACDECCFGSSRNDRRCARMRTGVCAWMCVRGRVRVYEVCVRGRAYTRVRTGVCVLVYASVVICSSLIVRGGFRSLTSIQASVFRHAIHLVAENAH